MLQSQIFPDSFQITLLILHQPYSNSSIDFDTIGVAGPGSTDHKGGTISVHDMQSRLSISPLPLDLGLLTSMANLDERRKAGRAKNGKGKKNKRSRSKQKGNGGKRDKGRKVSSVLDPSSVTGASGKKRARSPTTEAEARQAELARGFAAFAKNTGVSAPASSKKRKKGKKEHEIPDDLFLFGEFAELAVEDALDDHRCAGIIRRLGSLKYTQQVCLCSQCASHASIYVAAGKATNEKS